MTVLGILLVIGLLGYLGHHLYLTLEIDRSLPFEMRKIGPDDEPGENPLRPEEEQPPG